MDVKLGGARIILTQTWSCVRTRSEIALEDFDI